MRETDCSERFNWKILVLQLPIKIKKGEVLLFVILPCFILDMQKGMDYEYNCYGERKLGVE